MSSLLMLLWYCLRGRAAPSDRERRACVRRSVGWLRWERGGGGGEGKRERARRAGDVGHQGLVDRSGPSFVPNSFPRLSLS